MSDLALTALANSPEDTKQNQLTLNNRVHFRDANVSTPSVVRQSVRPGYKHCQTLHLQLLLIVGSW